MLKNYYQILNISRNSTNENIKKSYRQLVMFWHPDRNLNPEANDKIIEINEAYEILKDETKRKVYDNLYEEVFNVSIQKHKDKAYNYKTQNIYTPPTENMQDYELLRKWIEEAGNKINKFMKESRKQADSALETSAYVVGEVGSFLTTLGVIIFMGAVLITSIKYIVDVFSQNSNLSILSFTFSVVGILLSLLTFTGLVIQSFTKK